MRLTVPITVLSVVAIASLCLASTDLVIPGFTGSDSSAAKRATPNEVTCLDTLVADYLEDEHTNRRLAILNMRLEARDGRAFLSLEISATGPTVDPVPSFRGVHGANHITARDLTELLDARRIRIVAMPRLGSGKRFGIVRPTVRGFVPERRLLPGGELDLDAKSAERYVLAIDCESPALPSGEHEIYVEVKGLPRLRIDVRVAATGDACRGDILGIECLGGHDVRIKR